MKSHERRIISTTQAPEALGTYSQAVRINDTVYLSGQIPLNPFTGEIVEGDFEQQMKQVFDNMSAVCKAAGGDLDDIVKMNIYLVDLANFDMVNAVMGKYFNKPYPARVAMQVSRLPKDSQVEADAIMVLNQCVAI